MSYTHTLACSHTQMYTYPHTFIHTSSSITLKHSHYLHTHPAHPCMHTHTNTLTQHIHISAYSNLVSRPSHLQFLFVCSMLKWREKAWDLCCHTYMYIHATNLVICASYKEKRTCMMSGRQRVDMRGAVPCHCTASSPSNNELYWRCCLESLNKIFQLGSRDSS